MFTAISSVSAHEIQPGIADVTIQADRVTIEIRLAVESMVAGLDLSDIVDTDASPLAQRYDDLRALSSEALNSEFQSAWPKIRDQFTLLAGDTPVVPDFQALEAGPVGDIALARESLLRLSAALPADNSPVSFGWSGQFGPLVVRHTVADNDGYSVYLTGGDISDPLPRDRPVQQPWIQSFANFVAIGFQHIVPKGLDHILFVLGLFFFSLNLRPLLTQITAFTVAHTVTLACATLGLVSVSPAIVEPLIAASIVYVAVENLMTRQLKVWRTALVFGFGLLHGLGFASVLGDIGLEPGRFLTGLIGFNLGVEAGQLLVITAAFMTVGYWFGHKRWYRPVISQPASIAIAIVGAVWFFQRIS